MKRYLFIPLILAALIPAVAFASDGGGGEKKDITAIMTIFALQLGVIVVIARTVGLVLKNIKLSIPSVLVELLIGIAIGPYLLGGIALPGFPEGIFPISTATSLPISPELYGIATVASIIMLFSAGLETDLSLLLKFSVAGLLVGVGGVIASFAAGAYTTIFLGASLFHKTLTFSDPLVLFMGMIGMSTSLGITARILSEERKMDSPEGVTTLAAAVMDDVLGLIVLTVVTSIIAMSAAGGGAEASGNSANTAAVIIKAVGVLLVFTFVGIAFARPLSKVLKSFKSAANISIFALGLALILAGIFEMAGLALIIGAYVIGLSLSKTDLADTVRDTLETTYDLFVPFFFIVMGMLVDVHAILSREVLIFGVVYSLAMVAGKVVGCGFPTVFLNFNMLGTLRVGFGMVPRGEVSIIIAGIGLAAGFLDPHFFGVAILMVFVNNLLAPPFASKLFKNAGKGTKKELAVTRKVSTPIEIASSKLAATLEQRLVEAFRAEAFFVHTITIGPSHNVYRLRKDDINITLDAADNSLVFESDARDVTLIKTVSYEVLLQIHDIVTSVQDLIKPDGVLKNLAENAPDNTGAGNRDNTNGDKTAAAPAASKRKIGSGEIRRALTQGSIIPNLTGSAKREIVEKLVGILHSQGTIEDRDGAIAAVMEREALMSTGMQNGVALPHARTDVVNKITVAVGLSQDGIDYKSIDGKPSKIFVLILSPMSTESPHIQFLASISALLNSEEARAKLLACSTQEEIYNFFKNGLGS